MNFLTPPRSAYKDAYNQEKYRFVWRVYWFLIFTFSGLSILHLFLEESDILLTLIALGAMIVSVWITARTGTYTFAAIFGGVVGSLLNQADLFLILNSQKFVNILWIVSVVLYIFYLLGSKAGFITLVINLTGVAISLYVIPKEVLIDRIEDLDSAELLSIVVNLIMITIFISFLMYQMLKSGNMAEKKSKIAQEQLRKQYQIVQRQNEEKTVMLREIHHRVKNNLQIITSLLRMQSKDIKDPETYAHFQEAINRVATMALIHEKMYGSKELSKINLKPYLESLAEEILNTYKTDCDVSIDIHSELNYVQPKSLVSTAIILNELITNSLKHAFKGKKTGQIKIAVSRPTDEKLVIDYHDNGSWTEKSRNNSFGTELIETFTEQLDGKYELKKEKGTHYHFEFEIHPKSAASLISS